MTAPLLLFAIGNESRGDDALAPLLLRCLAAWADECGLSGQIELLEDFQLQIEHAMDMRQRRLVLFIDAGVGTPLPFLFQALQPSMAPQLYTHALTPDAMLAVYCQLYGEMLPPSFVLCLRGERFELGEGLSDAAERHLAAASEFLVVLLATPEPVLWSKHCVTKKMS